MKTFKSFLIENNQAQVFPDLNSSIDYIKENCRPYITEFEKTLKSNIFLSRGMSFGDKYFVEPIRQDRKPADTPLFLSNAIDDWFDIEFGFPYRSASLFTSMDQKVVEGYGPEHLIFPVGNFKFCYSTVIRDLFIDMIGIAGGDKPGTIKDDLMRSVQKEYGDDYPEILTNDDPDERNDKRKHFLGFSKESGYQEQLFKSRNPYFLEMMLNEANYVEGDVDRLLGLDFKPEIMIQGDASKNNLYVAIEAHIFRGKYKGNIFYE